MPANIIDLKGKTAFITGGTMGIGAAIVEELRHAGAALIITGAENQDTIDKMNDEAGKKGYNMHYIRADFSQDGAFENLFSVLDSYPRIDICVNNAGTNRNNPVEEVTAADFDFLLEINLKAPFRITQYMSRRMKKVSCGRIVNIASIWSVNTRPGRSAYAVTKSAIIGLTKTAAVELASYNVLVNAVSPGFTMTELTKKTVPEKEIRELQELIPAKRFAEPHEIAKTVLFLVSDLNTYITAQNIIIDGGFTNV
ncbi:MAG: 3-oxoacyl-(acyl-carrier-protein) reductase FabG [Bacteroidetes bacterium ADurb.Bin408]|nr:MAG: 3-oxoacyl-(acyl-carrier-protein) reductase FabG [Bacteroidetes bacterium ADurb.Bin408]